MDDCRNSLEALEKLLNEFFSPGTSNERQRELENILSTFSGRPESWRLCLQFLTLTSNQYVAMYCLATIESVITKRWLVLLTEEKSELTSLLYKHLLARHAEFPHFIRNKLLKLIVDIARYDWPHFYPDFFMNICKMIQDPNTTVLGLSFLQTASEELICPREDLSVCRKDELKRLFTAHIPNVFKIICDVLEGVKEGRSSQAVGAAALQAVCHLFSWVPLESQATHSALLALFLMYLSYRYYDLPDVLKGVKEGRSSQAGGAGALQAVCHLFSWVPLESQATHSALLALFLMYLSFRYYDLPDVLKGVKEGRSSQAGGAGALQAVCHLFSWVPLESQATHSALLALFLMYLSFRYYDLPDVLKGVKEGRSSQAGGAGALQAVCHLFSWVPLESQATHSALLALFLMYLSYRYYDLPDVLKGVKEGRSSQAGGAGALQAVCHLFSWVPLESQATHSALLALFLMYLSFRYYDLPDVLKGVKEGRSSQAGGAGALQAVCHLFSWVPLESQATHSALLALFLMYLSYRYYDLPDVLEGVKEGRSSQAVGAAALQAVCHLFSWVPLQSQATHSALLALVFHFTCTPDNLGVCALAVLNEVLYKNCVPHSLLPSVFVVCTQNHQLLHLVLQQSDLANIDENYINKLTEMSHLCLSKHWHRIEQNHLFPVNDFLYALYQYTFRQPSVTAYYACLEVWTSLLDYLADKDAVHIQKYEEFATALVEAIIKKMRTEQDLDDEKTDDDEETERQVFIRHNIEVIGKIGDIVPMATCSRVVDAWQKCCAAYSKLLFAPEPPQPSPDLRRVLLDCAALTQTVGHIHGHLAGTMNLSMSLSSLAVAASRAAMHEKVTDPEMVKLFVAVHAEVIATLPTWLSPEHVNNAVEACLPLLQTQHPVKLQFCAAHLLAALANKKYSPHPLPSLLPLFQASLGHLNQETQTLVQSALCRILMTCPSDVQTEDQRLELMTNLVKSMMPSGTQDLRQITTLLVHCKPENKQAKQLLYSALQPVLENVIAEFPVRMNSEPQVCDQMLSFFLEAFRALQEHIGADMTQRAVETFINAFRSVDIITRECGVDKLLQLLVLIVEQASGIFKQFIPSCVTLCLDHIYPAVYNSPNSNIKPCLFHLLSSILLHKWQYFYSGTVADGEPELQNGHQLAAILQAFGESLMQNDITLFSQNLQALEILNLQWKLYQRELFRTQFLPEYLTLLLNTLILKTHALRADEIATAIFNMASVDFETFYLFFLPHFLDHTTGLDSNQRMVLRRNMKADQDLPTFIQNVHRLANDIRCYRLCNGTNPAAT